MQESRKRMGELNAEMVSVGEKLHNAEGELSETRHQLETAIEAKQAIIAESSAKAARLARLEGKVNLTIQCICLEADNEMFHLIPTTNSTAPTLNPCHTIGQMLSCMLDLLTIIFAFADRRLNVDVTAYEMLWVTRCIHTNGLIGSSALPQSLYLVIEWN